MALTQALQTRSGTRFLTEVSSSGRIQSSGVQRIYATNDIALPLPIYSVMPTFAPSLCTAMIAFTAALNFSFPS